MKYAGHLIKLHFETFQKAFPVQNVTNPFYADLLAKYNMDTSKSKVNISSIEGPLHG